ncbi:MAG TPA: PDZ domain-containing protein [Candidatus Baltobacteraceae bacterium]|nr:PDZ domain-containing protein [Candidatus Baltobacteraceae bacterium]
MRLTLARNRFRFYVAAAVLAAVASFVPTPYSLMLPGRAVDLRQVVSVAGRTAPSTPFFLTDVRFASRVTPLQMLAGILPGAALFRTHAIVPGSMTAVEYEGVEREAMSESQSIAAVVAERAAGLKVPYPRSRVLVVYFSPSSHASKALRPLDMLVALNGHPIASNGDVIHALANVRPGATVRMAVMRRGGELTVAVPTMKYGDRTALGAYLTTIYQRPHIPVAVAFHLPDVSGSSGGLMFALDIYRRLRPQALRETQPVAGTGTIAYDGSVGPIEGAWQKVIAARRAGAKIFLVPQENYKEVAGTPGIRVIPVSNFKQALHALGA